MKSLKVFHKLTLQKTKRNNFKQIYFLFSGWKNEIKIVV